MPLACLRRAWHLEALAETRPKRSGGAGEERPGQLVNSVPEVVEKGPVDPGWGWLFAGLEKFLTMPPLPIVP